MVTQYLVGYKVTIRYTGESRGKFHFCFSTLSSAKAEAWYQYNHQAGVEEVRVYSKNSPMHRYGMSIVFSLNRKELENR